MKERSLQEYRDRLNGVATVSVELVREIIDVAEAEIETAHGEFSLSQAVGISGRSRSWFERRLPTWQIQGLARKVGRVWLLKRAIIPSRRQTARGAFDPSTPNDSIIDSLLAS